MSHSKLPVPFIKVLGVRVNPVGMSDVLQLMEHWIKERDSYHYVVATGIHGVMEARSHPDFRNIVDSAALLVPDGYPLVWMARRRGFRLNRRVCGTDLLWEFSRLAEQKGYRVFLYGDTDDTLQKLTRRLKESFPHLQIAGCHSPPFRTLTPEEKAQEVGMINESAADVVWVGLGLPKQERWMSEHKDELNVPVVVGVGAAFKFLSGKVNRAPNWIGDRGFEWLWRLLHEPRRVWRRVLWDGPRFAGHLALELSGLKKYE